MIDDPRLPASGVSERLDERAWGVAIESTLETDLCATQCDPRLLHGDLQHYNVLLDAERGWLAIDPKGVVGELAYEIGAALRNPFERPDLFTAPRTVSGALRLDEARVLAWGFAQAVLSALWSIEDGEPITADNPALLLAETIRPRVS